jgi:ribosomal protein S18 acetylase RimI-like enzyme
LDISRYRATDAAALQGFAASLPQEDRNFLKEDVTDASVVRTWDDQPAVERFVARVDDRVVGYVALHPLGGWSRHVAELRVVVALEARDLGVGQRLVRQGLLAAIEAGVEKVLVEVVADHHRTVGMLQANGFAPEALLVDQVRDRQGQLRDLMVLTCRTDELVDALVMVGVGDAVQPTS